MKRRDFHETPDPLVLLRPRRKIVGMSAILLPFTAAGAIDWEGFARHVERTFGCGLVPAVNMDTGFAALLPPEERTRALEIAQGLAAGREYIAGAFVADSPGDAFALDAYRREIDLVRAHGGTPIIFPSYGLTGADPTVIFGAFASIARHCPRFFAFELGEMFLPSGKIFPMDVFAGLLDLPECVGAKHSSLRRDLEWQRLTLRNWRRPDFLILTGNDLAIDMVAYGSDYLLGLSTFAPDYFAKRDAYWAAGDERFYAINDVLQYLGFLAFRPPVPAYRHSAAQFLKLRGWIESDSTHPQSPRRPESDLPLLADIWEKLQALG